MDNTNYVNVNPLPDEAGGINCKTQEDVLGWSRKARGWGRVSQGKAVRDQQRPWRP